MTEVVSHRPSTATAQQVGRMSPFRSAGRDDAGGKSHGQLTVEDDRQRDAQPMTVRCARCPDFVAIGPARHAHSMFLEHLREQHPEVQLRKRRAQKTSFGSIWAGRAREEAAA